MNLRFVKMPKWVTSLRKSITDWVMTMIGSVRIIWTSMLEGIAQARKARSASADSPKDGPTCENCGCATIRARRDHQFEIGSTESKRTEPLVKATITYNVPVYQCVNPKCGYYYMDYASMVIIDPIYKFLLKHIEKTKSLE
jgi:hypothetical protein